MPATLRTKLLARLAPWLFYPSLAWNVLLGRVLRVRPWWSQVDDHLLVGALPLPADVSPLAKLGVRGVINTCREYAGPQAAYREHGIEQLRLPTTDFLPPTLADVDRGVAFIRRFAEQGDMVYLHCKAGRGRSATVALCWLIQQENLTPAQAQQWLWACRSHVDRHLYRRDVVQQFYARHVATSLPCASSSSSHPTHSLSEALA